jgi:hypothetical protein
MCHDLIDECAEAGVLVKIPLLVLSGWSEWADALKDETKVVASRVKSSDERAAKHSWHQADIPTRPSTPTGAVKAIIEKYSGEFGFIIF